LLEWTKRLKTVRPVPTEKTYFLSSDLTAATDHCEHETSKAMLEGFIRGSGYNFSSYDEVCIDLLCSPRVYEGPDLDFLDRKTSQGILMGDPGAKLVLTLHKLCAEAEARFVWRHKLFDATDEQLLTALSLAGGIANEDWLCFACSGDDHFGQGPKSYLARITENHSRNGMVVSKPQNFLSSRGGFYCEEIFSTVGLDPDQIWGVATPLSKREYLSQPHVDAMKVRLFSPCAKEHEGKDEPNPAIGKARQVHGMLAWLGGGWTQARPVFSRRWEQRMSGFLPASPALKYLPTLLGGLEVPAYHHSLSDMNAMLNAGIPSVHMNALYAVFNCTANPLLRRALSTLATNARARGISNDLIQDQIEGVLRNADLVRGLDDAGMQCMAGIPDDAWEDMRHRDKAVLAASKGYITVQEAINLIDRPYIFRDLLFPEMSIKHGIDPYKVRQYTSKPWDVRDRMFLTNLANNTHFEQEIPAEEVKPMIDKISHWAVSNEALDLPRENYWLPRGIVVHEELATLRTPLPFNDPGIVKAVWAGAPPIVEEIQDVPGPTQHVEFLTQLA
jgi:hypothetical protein